MYLSTFTAGLNGRRTRAAGGDKRARYRWFCDYLVDLTLECVNIKGSESVKRSDTLPPRLSGPNKTVPSGPSPESYYTSMVDFGDIAAQPRQIHIIRR